ncbi:MAG: glycosyltransferase family 39 protein [Flavobacteriaceae bacterium]
MISNLRYWFFMLLIVLVYIAGLFVTLFENDSAQFAVMAMRMVQENDFVNLIKGNEEYLDKPHLHYWLAGISYLIFGIQDWAYRIPGVLASLLAALSCYGLGKELYREEVGKLAALIFLTAQTIVLSNIDVRTDAVLTGFTAFSLWQLVRYIKSDRLIHLVLGAIGAGLAFSTKGQIAILVIGLPILCHLWYKRRWDKLIHWRTLIGILVFILVLIPVLYAYYQQFDLHPEKVIRGRGERSGIFFILWEQSFERLSGEGVGKNSSDYFFFFHTFLWVFLPWTIIGILAFTRRWREILRSGLKRLEKKEFLTAGGITLIFILISFAQFKLPHYLNITIPLFAVLSASYLWDIAKEGRLRLQRFLIGTQLFIASLVVIVSLILCLSVFEAGWWGSNLLLLVGIVLLIYLSWRSKDFIGRIITISVCSAILLNGVMNLHFYPSLLNYQGGSSMSEIVHSEKIPVDSIYKLSERHTWGLDFYNRYPVKLLSVEDLGAHHDLWLYITDKELKSLQQLGHDWDRQYTVDQFRITRLQGRFLNPASRKEVLNKMHLVHLY